MGLNLTRTVWRVGTDGRTEAAEEWLAAESPWTLRVNGQELVTLIASPADLEDLAIGYLANEGLITRADQVSILVVDDEEGQIWVRVPELRLAPEMLGRRLLTSCCGRGRPSLYFLNDASLRPVTERGAVLSPSAVMALVAALDAAAPAFHQSGGLHSAALTAGTALLAVRSDVGRHNALDKLAGWRLRQETPAGEAIVFSGRISSEVVVKVARMDLAIILSNAAPTSLGCELAEDLGITTVGFVRQGRLNIYTHPHRIQTARRSV